MINPFIFGGDLREGMRSTVVCSVLSGESPLRIVWLKDEQRPAKEVHPDIEILNLGEFTSTLTFNAVNRAHSGKYTCKASSKGIDSNFTALMTVQGLLVKLFYSST